MSRIKSALVTGATGFIGFPLCHALARQGVEVTALARRLKPGPWNSLHVCDLESDSVSDEIVEGVDTVFHLASRVHVASGRPEDAEAYRRVNVQGTQKLLEAANRNRIARFIFFSSVKAVGEGGTALVNEDTTPEPRSDYGKSKLEAETLVRRAGATGGFSTTILRLPLVYGPGVKGNLRDMIDGIASGKFPPIAASENRRSMIHVDDVAAAALLAAGSQRAEDKVYFLTDGREYSTRELYDAIRSALGKPRLAWSIPVGALTIAASFGDVLGALFKIRPPLNTERLEKLVGSARYDGRRFHDDVGFAPAHDFTSTVAEMVSALGTVAGAEPANIRS